MDFRYNFILSGSILCFRSNIVLILTRLKHDLTGSEDIMLGKDF